MLSRFLGGSDPHAQDRYIDRWLKGLDEGGILSSAGVRVTVPDALTVPGISACIQVLAEDIAKVPAILYRKKADGDRERAEDHPLYEMLKIGPSPWLSSSLWRQVMIHNACAYGNAYSRVWRTEGAFLDRFSLIQPGTTTQRWQEDGEPFFDVVMRGGVARGLSWQDVIHVPYRASNDGACDGGVIGTSPIMQNKETVALAIAAERYATKFFANGAKPSAVLQMDKKLPSDEVGKRIRAGIERVYGGVENSFKVAILELGLELKEWSFDPEKSQMTETRKEQAVQACTMYRMPPHKIGILDKATFSNIEQQSIDYVTGPVSSVAEALESAIETACLTPEERKTLYVELNLDGLMRGDLLSRYQAYAIGRQWGWLNADTIRAWENLNKIPDGAGEAYLNPMNMIPAGTTPPPVRNDGQKVLFVPIQYALPAPGKLNGDGRHIPKLIGPSGEPLIF